MMAVYVRFTKLFILDYQGASQCFGPAGDRARVATFHQPSIRIMEDSY